MNPDSATAGPDPARVRTLDDLARELTLLRSRAARGSRSARVTIDDLAARVGEPRSTIHTYVTGRRLPPTQILDRIVIALGTTPVEQREWAEAWYRADSDREVSHRARACTGRGSGVVARNAVPRQLPAAVDAFTGRRAELAALDALVGPDREPGAGNPLAVLRGTAGVGKTALALQWAHAHAARFPDGQLFVDLHGYDEGDPVPAGRALAGLLHGLGVVAPDVPRGQDERAGLYRSLVAGRQVLLVLDNAHDSEQVRPLLPGTASCTVVVTSRDCLTGLVVRDGAHAVHVDLLTPDDAISLLRALLADVRSDDAELAALARHCADLPLALRAAAERAAGGHRTSVARVVDDLADERHELDLLDAGDDPATALRTVFSWSYRWLPPDAARTFRLASLHPGADLTTPAVAALTGTDDRRAARLLDRLARAHLVQRGDADRYRMHRLLRCFAAELTVSADGADVRRAAVTGLFDHYLNTATRAIAALPASWEPARAGAAPDEIVGDAERAYRWLAAERHNLVAVIAHVDGSPVPRQTVLRARAVAAHLARTRRGSSEATRALRPRLVGYRTSESPEPPASTQRSASSAR